ncbi:hypothetical protein [Sagittula salina]|uniref:Uncharacterized protein n=1 Tax=Sagittula salina TaxID=2820268 RepID=A0A940MRQ8_9RHOB|nr:hypothetical protein [Sagittula salina]MBP0483802.1 hypothetical protein [Sagittula salina]
MEDALNRYRHREDAVRRKHARLAKGYVTKLDRNGVYVQVPDSKAGGMSLRVVLYAAVIFFGFKVMILTGLGEADYGASLQALSQGSLFERAGAWMMQADPLTAKLSELVSLLIT